MAFDDLHIRTQAKVLLVARRLGETEAETVTLPNGYMSAIPKKQIIRELEGTRRALAKEIAKGPQRVEEIVHDPANTIVYAAATTAGHSKAVRGA